MSLSLPSYAKLNLALEITGRRPDGYHNLRTLFERIDLHDDLSFASTRDGLVTIQCDHPAIPCDQRNLIWKTGQLMRETFGIKEGAVIRLNKRIPVAAGLAGGSSNAATTIMGLDRLWKLELTLQQKVALARKVGSDVAFFLYDQAWGLGTERGDRIRPLDIKARLWHVLITPKIPVLTRAVYQTYARLSRRKTPPPAGGDFSLTNGSDDVTILIRSLRKNDILGAGALFFNDLERSILKLQPHLGRLKRRLENGPVLGVSFSGSGPSIFALTANQNDAESLKEKFLRTYQQVFVVQTRN